MKKWNNKRKSAPTQVIKESTFIQILPSLFFTVFILLIIRLTLYNRPMTQFFWTTVGNDLIDFYSHGRMIAIVGVGILASASILLGLITQPTKIKHSFIYIPIAVYCLFVILSYLFSDFKDFALLGYNDRFEGTLTLLAYMVMLIYTFNVVNSEKNVKWILYPLAVVCVVLCILGILQFYGINFLNFTVFKKLITPKPYWGAIDAIQLTASTFTTQTLYNQNYVAFYIMLPITLFGMMTIWEKDSKKKICWALLVALLVYNLIGSISTGGVVGLFVSIVISVVVFGPKRLIEWWRSIALLVAFSLVVTAITMPRLAPELSDALKSVVSSSIMPKPVIASPLDGAETEPKTEDIPVNPVISTQRKIDYIETGADTISISIDGQSLTINIVDRSLGTVVDANGNALPLDNNICSISQQINEGKRNIIVINTDENNWFFVLTDEGPRFISPSNQLIPLRKIPSWGFKNNLEFATYRGYIWSLTFPMLKDTFFVGHGADTFCIYFPHDDYAGKYNIGYYNQTTNRIVDKPHNMYLGAAVGTGVISMLALLVLYGFYVKQSFSIYRKLKYDEFLHFVGSGIFIGICGFLVAGLVNDSNVGVMPLFYGLLGIGFAINRMLSQKQN